MFKNSKPYLLATILIGMGLANLFRSLDAVHHTINLFGLTLLLYSLLLKLFLLMIAEIILYLIAYLCNRKNKDMYIRLFKVSVLMTLLYYISSRI